MTYLIHGATGAQGAPVAAALSRSGHHVTAAVRNTAAYTAGPAVAVDTADLDSLVDAYTGADGVFVHLPLGSPAQQLEQATTIATAVDRARPGRVVFSTSGYTLGGDNDEDDSAHGVLVRRLEASGVPTAVIAPRLYLENLLLPPVITATREEGILPYPIREDFLVSWSSHLDIAEVALRLFEDPSVTGVVTVGALPGLSGPDLAKAFSNHFGREVRFHAQTPDEFGEMIIPIFGADGIAPVVDSYRWRATLDDELIDETRSAQALLGLAPRSVEHWLRDIGA
ncbi:hydroxylase [Plantibacter flavus]|uniref:SDR family oxidoreductase n=1 Tax=Plantibacter TaxID=190323 RepID=UPI0010C1DC1D|nr:MULTISPECIES: NmrA family NAD(P)-binding protein [Plantibacter]MBD8103907.1 NmrA family NAD(P)-binding protein [Plantibacter sp. CFBP 8775]MBD8467355.1 NmrA family NAD(P)-binding protein [Plantibacter sp. CFBP 8798]MBD8518585.1 NmrA family NAD(P)-binding protein [Plantibacter sp. CFBP 8804]TKJ96821.1 hydroxylase [Plantibacter flavus]